MTRSFIEEIFSQYKKSILQKEKIKREEKNYQIICINDLHIPHQDEKSLQLVFDFIIEKQPNELVLNGDILDCYWLSAFLHNPSIKIYTQQECDIFYKLFSKLRKHIPNTAISFIPGNHEDRIIKETWKNPGFYGLRSLEWNNLLNFDKLNISYYPKRRTFRNFTFTHGNACSKHASYTAKIEFEDHKCQNGLSGHTHRMGWYNKSCDKVIDSWYENGCLCSLDPEYIKDVVNWQQGFSVINFYDNLVFVDPILIKENKFSYEGKLYK
jgi:predicted phosphodiesterase